MIDTNKLLKGHIIAYTTHPVIVRSIGKNSIGFQRLKKGIDTEFEREVNDHNFTGIPITPSILDKCKGWEKEDPKYGEAYRMNDRFIVRRVNYAKGFETPDYGYAVELSTEKDWATVLDRCDTLHELQLLTTALGVEMNVEI